MMGISLQCRNDCHNFAWIMFQSMCLRQTEESDLYDKSFSCDTGGRPGVSQLNDEGIHHANLFV